MATTTKIVLTMETSNGDKSFSYNYASSTATTASVKAVGTALVTNGDIFENVPTALKAAKLVTTNEAEFDLS